MVYQYINKSELATSFINKIFNHNGMKYYVNMCFLHIHFWGDELVGNI